MVTATTETTEVAIPTPILTEAVVATTTTVAPAVVVVEAPEPTALRAATAAMIPITQHLAAVVQVLPTATMPPAMEITQEPTIATATAVATSITDLTTTRTRRGVAAMVTAGTIRAAAIPQEGVDITLATATPAEPAMVAGTPHVAVGIVRAIVAAAIILEAQAAAAAALLLAVAEVVPLEEVRAAEVAAEVHAKTFSILKNLSYKILYERFFVFGLFFLYFSNFLMSSQAIDDYLKNLR
jgi:hypothetical protein